MTEDLRPAPRLNWNADSDVRVPRWSRRRKIVLAIAAGLLILLLLIVIAIRQVARVPAISVGFAGIAAAERLADAPGARYRGVAPDEISARFAAPVPTDMTLTRGGARKAHLTTKHGEVDVLSAFGADYVKAPAGYWISQGRTKKEAAEQAGHWRSVFAGSTDPLPDHGGLALFSLAERLRSAKPVLGPSGGPVISRVDGLPTFAYRVDGERFDVTAAEPHRLVHVTGTGLDVRVRTLTKAEWSAALKDMHNRATEDAADLVRWFDRELYS